MSKRSTTAACDIACPSLALQLWKVIVLFSKQSRLWYSHGTDLPDNAAQLKRISNYLSLPALPRSMHVSTPTSAFLIFVSTSLVVLTFELDMLHSRRLLLFPCFARCRSPVWCPAWRSPGRSRTSVRLHALSPSTLIPSLDCLRRHCWYCYDCSFL